MLRQLVIFAAVAAGALLLARMMPGDQPLVRAVRYSLYVVSLVAGGFVVWVVLAATVFGDT